MDAGSDRDATSVDAVDVSRHSGQQQRTGTRAVRGTGRAVVAVAAAGVLTWLLLAVRGDVADAVHLLGHVRVGWTMMSFLAGFVTLVLFSGVRAVLVDVAGGRLGVGDAVGLTYASGAIAASVPAGGPIATAYVFGQYRQAGADTGGATWALLINGVITPGTLAGIALVGVALASPNGAAAVLVPVVVAVVFVIVATAILRSPHVLARPIAFGLRLMQRMRHAPTDSTEEQARELTDRLAEVHPSRANWTAAIGLQVASWLVDVACLAAAILAVGGTVPWRALLAVYSAGMLVGRLPLLPAGLGQVETGLVVGLSAAGVPVATGLAATLVYRVASQWIVVPIGWVAWWFRRRRTAGDGGGTLARPRSDASPNAGPSQS